jgi:predicted nucleotidyltransferase
MNIHIKDIDLFERLAISTLFSIDMGSKMYGLTHELSDTDTLCIYATSDDELMSFYMTHHQIQYKENNRDYIFTNIHSFIRNAINGDSTINFEVINSDKLIGTDLEFLYNLRKSFYNYKIIRSYLGLAKRDIQRVDKDGKGEFDKNKKIAHAYRGLVTAKKIANNEEIKLTSDEISLIKNEIWTLKGYNERLEYSKKLLIDIENFRNSINNNKSMFANFMSVENQKELDVNLKKLINSEIFRNKKLNHFDMNLIYDANENGIDYV